MNITNDLPGNSHAANSLEFDGNFIQSLLETHEAKKNCVEDDPPIEKSSFLEDSHHDDDDDDDKRQSNNGDSTIHISEDETDKKSEHDENISIQIEDANIGASTNHQMDEHFEEMDDDCLCSKLCNALLLTFCLCTVMCLCITPYYFAFTSSRSPKFL